MKNFVIGPLSVAVLLSASAAHGEAEKSERSKANLEAFGHRGQFGLRAGLVAGFRMIFRYDESPYCRSYDPMNAHDEQAKSCGHGAPLAAEFGLSYALLDFLEPYLWLRLGFTGEEETDTEPVQILGVGTRLYTMNDSAFKIFIEPAIAYEFEGGGDNRDPAIPASYDPNYSKDLIMHLAAGPQLDFHENAGAYLGAGLTTGIFRGIHSVLEFQLGVQGRWP